MRIRHEDGQLRFDLPDQIEFPDKVAAKLRKGHWSSEAENILLEKTLSS